MANIGSDEKVKVYGFWASPFSCRVQIALKLKGIPYEYIEEDLSNKSPELLHYNPITKLIPVLVHNGKPVIESLVIMEYIDETWKHNPILPTDPYDRATSRFWAKFIDDKCLWNLWMACWGNGEVKDKAVEESHSTLKTLDDHIKLEKENIFAGDGGGFVEMAANTVTHWIDVVQEAVGVELITEAKYPTLCQWSKEYKTRALMKDFLPPRDALLAYYKARYEIYTASRSQS